MAQVPQAKENRRGPEDTMSSSMAFRTVVPHDTNVLTYVPVAIYIGGTGDVKVTDQEDNAVSFVAVPQGTILPIKPKIIWSIGTTATDIVAML